MCKNIVKIKKVLLVSILLSGILFSYPSHGQSKTDILFILYDAGETLALEPVMNELDIEKIPYKALVMGTARELLKGKKNIQDIFYDCKISEIIDSQAWPRDKSLNSNDLSKVQSCIEPKAIVTGMVSQVQLQISKAFLQSSKKVFAYYDAMSPLKRDSISFIFLSEIKNIWVPSQSLYHQFKELNPHIKVSIVGQPTLEKWIDAEKEIDKRVLFKEMPFINKKQKTILYAGGYGEGYEEAFSLFMKASNELSQYNILISLHPKVDGALERKIIEKYGNKNVYIIPKKISTRSAAVISDIIISQNSTVCIQAFFMGKSVAYLDTPNSTYANFAIQNGWIKHFSDLLDFKTFVNREIGQAKTRKKNIYTLTGIPTHSAKIIEALLKKHLSR